MKSLLALILLIFSIGFSYSQSSLNVRESLTIITDQSFYAAGDRITYHVYVLPKNPDPETKNYISNFAYVDLVDPDGNILRHQKLKLTKGVGKGDFIISDNIEHGYFRIFGYTSSMMDLSNEKIFTQEIPVYNPSTILEAEEPEFSVSISFLPEGGKIIPESQNKIVYVMDDKVIPPEGSKLKLVDQDRNLVKEIEVTGRNGTFEYLPEYGKFYSIVSENKVHQLPVVAESGVILRVSENKSFFILDPNTHNVGYDQLILKAYSKGREVHSTPVDLTIDKTTNIRKADLPDGLINFQLSLNAKILSERLVFNKHSGPKVDISIDNEVFRKGEQVNVSLIISDQSGLPVESVVTATVLPMDLARNQEILNSYNMTLIKSQTTSKLAENSASYPMDIMDFLITRNYDYEEMDPGPVELYQKMKLNIDPSSPGMTEELSFIAAYFLEDRMYMETRYESGEAVMDIPELQNTNHIWFAGFDTYGNQLGRIFLLNNKLKEISREYAPIQKTLHIHNNNVINYLNQDVKKKGIRKVYGVPAESEIVDEGFEPDVTIIPDDYIEESDVREFIVGIVPKATVKKKKGVENVYLSPAHTPSRFKSPPLYFINNIPTFRGSTILNLNLGDIDRIEVFNSFRTTGKFGISGRNGVLKIYLNEDAENPIAEEVESYPTVNGLTFSTFTSEGFVKPEDIKYPDFRSLLFTSLPLESDVQGRVLFSFNISDIAGEFTIFINGTTHNGKFVTGQKTFHVESVLKE